MLIIDNIHNFKHIIKISDTMGLWITFQPISFEPVSDSLNYDKYMFDVRTLNKSESSVVSLIGRLVLDRMPSSVSKDINIYKLVCVEPQPPFLSDTEYWVSYDQLCSANTFKSFLEIKYKNNLVM